MLVKINSVINITVQKARKNYNHERRWVDYSSGNVEASEVPPEFHGWLHHQTNDFPKEKKWI